jgi:hypothetical protein
MCLITVVALLASRETRGESLHGDGADDVQAETATVSP